MDDYTIIQGAYDKLIQSIGPKMDERDRINVAAAFELAKDAHKEQRRKSGEPYITHPIAVAQICVDEIGLGPTAVIAALLHDVVEDTPVTLADIKNKFGAKVAVIVDGLTKLDNDGDEIDSPQAENFRKVLRTLLVDVRVALIKISDRLHNMRTLGSMPKHKQQKIAAETKYIYVPLAHRLGIYNIKSEFEDLWLKINDRETYSEISKKLNQTKKDRNEYIKLFVRPLKKVLKELGVPFEIVGRPKTIFSIHNKIEQKHVTFEEIYDLFAIRIIVDVERHKEKSTCWQVYSSVTDFYRPIPERLKDWVTNPKANGYESLHTTVVGPKGRFVEVQIRSVRMNEIAEKGFAAHWKYKGVKNDDNVYDNWLETIRDTIESSDHNALEFLADLKSNLFLDEVYVFTPVGDMKVLPLGSTALDFAFSVHSEVGIKASTIKVNNRLVPFNYVLNNGDQVSVTTSKKQRANEDWLSFVVSGKAKTRIRSALKQEKKQQASFGKETLMRKLDHLKLNLEPNVEFLTRHYGFQSWLDFYYAISKNEIDLTQLKTFPIKDGVLTAPVVKVKKVIPVPTNKPKAMAVAGKGKQILINGKPAGNLDYQLAQCCKPVPGDEIFAYVSATQGMKIHRATCPNAEHMLAQFANHVHKAEWGETAASAYITNLVITGVDSGIGVIEKITNVISSNLGLNIRSFSIDGNDGFFEGKVKLVVTNTTQLNIAIQTLRKTEGIRNVIRES